MPVRGIRGAITADANTPEAINAATRELLEAMIERNNLNAQEIASAWFTTTPDLNAGFPAFAARGLGWIDVPLVCASEIPVPAALARVIRVLLHYNTDLAQSAVRHVYLRGAAVLREDLAARYGQAPKD
jgi:chorismate mutase